MNYPELWRDMDRDRPITSFGSFRPLLRQMDEFMNEAMTGGGLRTFDESRIFTPMVDVEETDNHYVMSFDVPGIDKKDINIEVQGNQLVVSGERKHETDRGEGRSRIIECRYGKFERAITLPEGINTADVEADYQNGVLTIAVPRASESKPQKVKIGEGKGGFFSKLLGDRKENESKTVKVKTADKSSNAVAS
ncbi:MAG: Hsp20/alpha crystallin family protein [Oligoflexales bacterium]